MQTKNRTNHRLGQVDVVILCGGLGSRLVGVVGDRPKPMAPIDRRPFLDILIDYFSGFGFRRFVLCTGHRSDVIREHYGGRDNPLEFVISGEPAALGTAGAVKVADTLIRSDPFLVTNGDSFCPVDLAQFYDFHLTKRALMSMAVVASEDREDGGLVTIDDCGQIVGFREKERGQRGCAVNAGIYLFQREILSLIPADTKCSLEYDLFPKLTGGGFAYICQGPLIDIGTPLRYEHAKEYFAHNAEIATVRSLSMDKARF
ncbi:MAG: nucleotidyltransferase family protein [Planctomycetota bacterium]|jgi:NDP-sugar pyrophosphorylase family protein